MHGIVTSILKLAHTYCRIMVEKQQYIYKRSGCLTMNGWMKALQGELEVLELIGMSIRMPRRLMCVYDGIYIVLACLKTPTSVKAVTHL